MPTAIWKIHIQRSAARQSGYGCLSSVGLNPHVSTARASPSIQATALHGTSIHLVKCYVGSCLRRRPSGSRLTRGKRKAPAIARGLYRRCASGGVARGHCADHLPQKHGFIGLVPHPRQASYAATPECLRLLLFGPAPGYPCWSRRQGVVPPRRVRKGRSAKVFDRLQTTRLDENFGTRRGLQRSVNDTPSSCPSPPRCRHGVPHELAKTRRTSTAGFLACAFKSREELPDD